LSRRVAGDCAAKRACNFDFVGALRASGPPPVSLPIVSSEPAPSADQSRWFADEVHRHDASLKAYLRGTFPAVRDVEDVVQESYLRIWKTRAATPIISARAFLFTVARRLALDLLRHERRSPIIPVREVGALFVLDQAPDAREAATTAQDTEFLVQAIDSLPVRCREIFILFHVEGLSQKEIAARLALSENTVAVQSARGLQRCEQFVRRRLGQP